MGNYVNPNNINLQLDRNTPIYVDKSMAIAEINKLVNTNQRFICMSRARRFGKTMVGNMLAAYYSKGCDSRHLFADLKIAKDPCFEKYLNKLNVIKFDIGAIYTANPNKDVIELITKRIRKELIAQFPTADIEEDDDTIESCLLKIYAATQEQFVFIIDEYDALIRERTPQEYFGHFLSFLNGLFKNPELSPAIALAYITGILPIVRDKVQSKLNIFEEYSMLGAAPLSSCIGFTNDEVKALCNAHNMDFEECKRWYDGYNLNGVEIYNSNSVVKAMRAKEFSGNWNQTGAFNILLDYILMDFEGILEDVKFMIGGGKVDVDTLSYLNTLTDFRCKDDVFTYLMHLGYLAYDRVNKQCYIPNREVRDEWIQSIKLAPDYKGVMELVNNSKKLIEATAECDSEAVATALDKAHTQICNNLNYNNEGTFQAVICLAYFYANLKYTIVKELPSGKGYADVAFIPYVPNVPAVIIELKRNKSAGTALTQIEEKRYFDCLEKYQGDLLFVGVNYDDETKVHTCKIKKFVK